MTTTAVRGGPVVTLWLLRGVVAIQLIMMAAQPILAGLFLDGELDAIAAHGLSGSLLVLTDVVQCVAALIYVLAERGKLWPLLLSVVMWMPIGLQIGMGYERNLMVHVPLGVTLLVLQVLLFAWLCGKSAGQPRSGGTRRGAAREVPDVK